MEIAKSIFTSKTFWFGVLQIAFGGVGYFTGWIDPAAASALVITGFGTIGLRIKTSQPVSF